MARIVSNLKIKIPFHDFNSFYFSLLFSSLVLTPSHSVNVMELVGLRIALRFTNCRIIVNIYTRACSNPFVLILFRWILWKKKKHNSRNAMFVKKTPTFHSLKKFKRFCNVKFTSMLWFVADKLLHDIDGAGIFVQTTRHFKWWLVSSDSLKHA